ncbi:hypothetical protein GALL_521770 [mine drainage metagenome]|uniref:Uncharacterized protein n=1 Tax=mine drainage metagenome TaxID=410659 RepID=A0A1J5P4Z6_9ZZZZ
MCQRLESFPERFDTLAMQRVDRKFLFLHQPGKPGSGQQSHRVNYSILLGHRC